MKKTIKAVILALVIAVMPLSAYASTMSTTFFNNTKLGYRRVGTGFISGHSCSAELTVTALPGTLTQPDEAYSSRIDLYVYGFTDSTFLIEHAIDTGHLTCTVTCESIIPYIHHTSTKFTFEESEIGTYELYN